MYIKWENEHLARRVRVSSVDDIKVEYGLTQSNITWLYNSGTFVTDTFKGESHEKIAKEILGKYEFAISNS